MPASYEKRVYIWEEPQPPIAVPPRLLYRSLPEGDSATFTEAVARVLAGSLDRHDQASVRRLGAAQAAAEMVAHAQVDFAYQPAWWQVAYDMEGVLVGFLQPVLYHDGQRDGLAEGTLYYIGVVPEQRGHHYIYDLLCQATHTLQAVGVWRIFCDTDTLNLPMQRAFEEVGYQAAGTHERPL
jgi:RimJ/RimL family protein N-acetyltransferase